MDDAEELWVSATELAEAEEYSALQAEQDANMNALTMLTYARGVELLVGGMGYTVLPKKWVEAIENGDVLRPVDPSPPPTQVYVAASGTSSSTETFVEFHGRMGRKRRFADLSGVVKSLEYDERHKLIKMSGFMPPGTAAGPPIHIPLSNGRRSGRLEHWERNVCAPTMVKRHSDHAFKGGQGEHCMVDSTYAVTGLVVTDCPCEMPVKHLIELTGWDRLASSDTANNASIYGTGFAGNNVGTDTTANDIGHCLHIGNYACKNRFLNTSNVVQTYRVYIARPTKLHVMTAGHFFSAYGRQITSNVATGGTAAANNEGTVNITGSFSTGETINTTTELSVENASVFPEHFPKLKKEFKYRMIKFTIDPSTYRDVIVTLPATRFKTSDFRMNTDYRAFYCPGYSYSMTVLCTGPVLAGSTDDAAGASATTSATSFQWQRNHEYRVTPLPFTHLRHLHAGDTTKTTTGLVFIGASGAEVAMVTDEGSAIAY